jgi:hypothetical protein
MSLRGVRGVYCRNSQTVSGLSNTVTSAVLTDLDVTATASKNVLSVPVFTHLTSDI